jgi:DNA repair exonuclease SbcCD ATPase subunit
MFILQERPPPRTDGHSNLIYRATRSAIGAGKLQSVHLLTMTSIETGVDKLVRLVQREKKIELGQAAKELGVAPAVVQEWADFLEQEGLVGTQFSFSKTFLVEKRLTQAEVDKKSKEYDSKKEGFVRKVDSTLKRLEQETMDFESIKKQYFSLKDQIGDQIESVREEVEQLRHYGELKKTIDQDILKQKVDYQKALDDIHTRITQEEKRFGKLIEDIKDEEKKVTAERGEFQDIKREEEDLQKRIEALQEILNSITTRLSTQGKTVQAHEERLIRLRSLAGSLSKEIDAKKKQELDPLLKISQDQEKRIKRIQDDIVNRIKTQRQDIQTYQGQAEEIAQRFEDFFAKQAKTEETLTLLEKSKLEMQQELNGLIAKAKSFDLTAKGADTSAHIKELEGKFKEFDKKRGAFADKLEDLKKLILGKSKPKVESAQKDALKAKTKKK